MSNTDIYNIIAPIGIVLAVVFGIWVNGQTKRIRQDIEDLKHENTWHKAPLRASRRK